MGTKKPLAFREGLYIGPEMEKYAGRVRRLLGAGKTVVGRYLITLAANPADELDIVPTGLLAQDILRERLPLVVGMAADRKEALSLVEKITADCLRDTGDVRLRSYLAPKEHDVHIS